MHKVPINFLLGFLLGAFFSMAYYDGFVARDYKEAISKYQDALEEANNSIIKGMRENDGLKQYLLQIIKEEHSKSKHI